MYAEGMHYFLITYSCPTGHRIKPSVHIEGDIAPRACPQCDKPTIAMMREASKEEIEALS